MDSSRSLALENKRVCWGETGKEQHDVITGSDGTKIIHSRVLPARPRLLIELRHYCGRNLPSDFPREPIMGL